MELLMLINSSYWKWNLHVNSILSYKLFLVKICSSGNTYGDQNFIWLSYLECYKCSLQLYTQLYKILQLQGRWNNLTLIFLIATFAVVSFVHSSLSLRKFIDRSSVDGEDRIDIDVDRFPRKIFLLRSENLLNFFKRFALGLRKQEVDVEEAGYAEAHVEPKRSVFIQGRGLPHVVEAHDDGESAGQVETRGQWAQNTPKQQVLFSWLSVRINT